VKKGFATAQYSGQGFLMCRAHGLTQVISSLPSSAE
jgi:hypothetical protein